MLTINVNCQPVAKVEDMKAVKAWMVANNVVRAFIHDEQNPRLRGVNVRLTAKGRLGITG